MSFANFPPFRPHPLFRSGHAQTIAGAYLPGARYRYQAHREFIELGDGDRIVLHDDTPASWHDGERTVLLVHGLGGGHQSGYMRRLAHRLCERGIRAVRMDLRGWGAGADFAAQPFHAACSGDVVCALRALGTRYPHSPISLIGFSLGANIVLKLLGDAGPNVIDNVDSALAVAPPIDLMYCSRMLGRGAGKIYDRNYARFLWNHLRSRTHQVQGYAVGAAQRRPRTIWDFDERFTAPMSGFTTVEEYYEVASSIGVLPQIAVPTVILAAADDPIVPLDVFETAHFSPQIELHVTEFGGHLGYLGAKNGDPDRRWMDWRIVEWTLGLAKNRPAIASLPARPGVAEENTKPISP